jgi:hypothetical protein
MMAKTVIKVETSQGTPEAISPKEFIGKEDVEGGGRANAALPM